MAHAQEIGSPFPSKVDLEGEVDALIGGGYTSSYGVAPNSRAAAAVKAVLAALPQVLAASRIAPMADGGIALIFQTVGTKAARVDITNDEEFVVTLKASPESRSVYREVERDEIVPTVEEFFRS